MKKSKCAMTCGAGTVLEGEEKLKCVEGATGWDWDGAWPICKEGKFFNFLQPTSIINSETLLTII